MILNKSFKHCLIFGLLLNISPVFSTNETTFKISSDSTIQDFANQIIIYKGNALFTTDAISVNGDQIKAFKSKDEIKKIRITGSLAKLSQYQSALNQLTQLSAQTINYQLDNQIITAEKNITLIQKTTESKNDSELEDKNESYFKAQGQKLNLMPAPQNILTMSGSPLKIVINQPNQTPFNIKANKMTYNQLSQQFELSGNVILSTGRETIKAARILYNGKTQILQLPESQGQRVEMIQAKKGTHE